MRPFRCFCLLRRPRRLLPAAAVMLLAALAASPLAAKTVVLEAGESYRDHGLDVLCVESRKARVIELTDCQYWDEFNKRCLYEKRVLSYGDLSCVEDCQHWEQFQNRCLYATRCTFYPDQGIFVRTECAEFDTFAGKCVRTKQVKISTEQEDNHE